MPRRIPWPQFSLRGLLLAVVFAAYACGALWNATDLWASATWSLALAVLAFAMLAVCLRRGRVRAFWLGFLLFGLGYLTLAHGPWFEGNVRHRLLTDKLLAWAYSLTPAGEAGAAVLSTTVAFSPQGGQVFINNATGVNSNAGLSGALTWIATPGAPAFNNGPAGWEQFQQVGHSLFALLLAFVGAIMARGMCAAGTHPASP